MPSPTFPMIGPLVAGIEEPPVAESAGWLRPGNFTSEMPLINVAQAVPGYGPATELTAHLSTVVIEDDTAFYTEVEGIKPLRVALAADISEVYGGNIAAEDVMITAGCNQAFYIAMMTLAKSGSSVILPAPWYFNHRMILDMMGVRVIPLPCDPGHGMVPDAAQAEALIDETTSAMVLVNPNNPTGAIYSCEVIEAFMDVAVRHGLSLVLDETYRDFLPQGVEAPHDLFANSDWRSTGLVHLYSFSKVFSLTGYRVGAIVTNPGIIRHAAKVMDCLAICAPHIGQCAALYGLQNLAGWRDEKRRLMTHRMMAFQEAIAESNSGYHIRSMGAYFAYMEHPFTGTSARDMAQRLASEQNLLCMPGDMFGPGQERLLRFAFANVDGTAMPEIARRLTADLQANR